LQCHVYDRRLDDLVGLECTFVYACMCFDIAFNSKIAYTKFYIFEATVWLFLKTDRKVIPDNKVKLHTL